MARPISELKKLSRAQIARLNKDDLVESILTSPDREADNPQLAVLSATLNALRDEVAQLKTALTAPDSIINKKFAGMQEQIDQQANIIEKQQQFMEMIDRKEREKNLVVLGLPDENESLQGATEDGDKIKKVWGKIRADQNQIESYRRLGVRRGNRPRPVLITMKTRNAKDDVLGNTKALKDAGESFDKVYIKKDLHPSVRAEWKRLREATEYEKQRPENAGCEIRLDTRERKLYRDNVVIDAWRPKFFQ